MESIQGPGMGPQDQKIYKQQYKHGLDLFQRALGEYSKADEIHKKDAFKKVMDQALDVLNETARGLGRKDLLEQNVKISDDYQSYRAHDTELEKNQLAQDLSSASKKIK